MKGVTMLECPAETCARPLPGHARPAVLNALTVDVEDYYHVSAFDRHISRADWPSREARVVASTHLLLDLFEKAGVQGTFFVLGWVADQQPQLVRDIAAAGHEIGCHSYWHRLVYQQTPAEFRADLRRARDVLQELLGQPIRAYRAPSFSITHASLWALDILLEEGFIYDSSIFPTYHDRYGMAEAPLVPHRIARPHGTLCEFPLTVYHVGGYPLPIGGGGYFRLYPYMFTRHAIRAVNAQGRPATVYLHPWEVDPGQPRIPVGRLSAFRHYVSLHRTQARLERLLQDFALGTLSAAFARSSAENDVPTWDLCPAA